MRINYLIDKVFTYIDFESGGLPLIILSVAVLFPSITRKGGLKLSQDAMGWGIIYICSIL